ncbi:hypothetical protein C0J52_08732 [Blattella germanica]|nr:hypothetical protein C0J52_08732 [Blattella germanica]
MEMILGMEECQRRINMMVEEAKTEARLCLRTPLSGLGMSLSGCEQEETNRQLKEELQKKYPYLSNDYVVCSDTVGSIAAALEKAWWISHKAIKVCFDDQDNFKHSPYPTEVVWAAIQEHYNIKTRFDMLDHCYTKFEKCFFAGLCKLLGQRANEGDKLSQWLFSEAGRVLALWLSWKHMESGFIEELHQACGRLKKLSLLRLTTSIATGSVYLAAKEIKYNMPRNYKNNHQIFFTYNRDQT